MMIKLIYLSKRFKENTHFIPYYNTFIRNHVRISNTLNRMFREKTESNVNFSTACLHYSRVKWRERRDFRDNYRHVECWKIENFRWTVFAKYEFIRVNSIEQRVFIKNAFIFTSRMYVVEINCFVCLIKI